MKKIYFGAVPAIGILLSITSCINARSNQSAPLTGATDECNVDPSLGQKLNTDCFDKLLSKLPFSELRLLAPPSSGAIQMAVKDRVTGYWPKWLLDDIKKEEKAGEKLVLYYYASLKLPSLLANKKNRNDFLVKTTLPKSDGYSTILGKIGDHAVAYHSRSGGKITLYDLQEHKVLGEAEVPIGGLSGGSMGIEDLGNKTFLLRREMRDLDGISTVTQFTIWRWGSAQQLELLHTITGTTQNNAFDFLGVSDKKFATWRYLYNGFQQTTKVVDLWSTEGLVSSIPLPVEVDKIVEGDTRCDSRNNRFHSGSVELSDIRDGLLQSLKYLESQGIKIDENLAYYNKNILGHKFDLKTLVIVDQGLLKFSSLDYRRIRKVFPEEQSPGQVSFVNKNGDIVFRDGSYANFWKGVKHVLADTK